MMHQLEFIIWHDICINKRVGGHDKWNSKLARDGSDRVVAIGLARMLQGKGHPKRWPFFLFFLDLDQGFLPLYQEQ
jgi:hypothetical protein